MKKLNLKSIIQQEVRRNTSNIFAPNDNYDETNYRAVMDPNTSADELRRIVSDAEETYDRDALKQVAMNPNTPVDILKKLASHRYRGIKYGLATNPNTPVDILKKLVQDSFHEEDAVGVAAQRNMQKRNIKEVQEMFFEYDDLDELNHDSLSEEDELLETDDDYVYDPKTGASYRADLDFMQQRRDDSPKPPPPPGNDYENWVWNQEQKRWFKKEAPIHDPDYTYDPKTGASYRSDLDFLARENKINEIHPKTHVKRHSKLRKQLGNVRPGFRIPGWQVYEPTSTINAKRWIEQRSKESGRPTFYGDLNMLHLYLQKGIQPIFLNKNYPKSLEDWIIVIPKLGGTKFVAHDGDNKPVNLRQKIGEAAYQKLMAIAAGKENMNAIEDETPSENKTSLDESRNFMKENKRLLKLAGILKG